jgi:hypothetical protein
MKWSFRWQSIAAVSLFLALILCGEAFSQSSRAYNDAVRMYGRYKQNQDQINALRQRIADNEAAIRSIRRDTREAAYGSGAWTLAMEAGPDIAVHHEAIDRDREALALLERRQAIIERSWENTRILKNYYGSLRETSGRTIYDPKTRQYVNLMDFRIDSFRNPGGRPTPPGVRSSSAPSSSPGQVGKVPSSRTTQATSKVKSSPKTSKSSSASKSKSSGGGTHTMSLVPVD